MNFFSQIADLQSKRCEISIQFDVDGIRDGSWTVRITHNSDRTEVTVREYSFQYDTHDLEKLWQIAYDKFMRVTSHGVNLQLTGPNA